MSLSFQPLEPVCVYDPRVMLNKHKTFPILKSGSQVTYKSWTTTSVSNSSMQFSAPPPSNNVIVDRMVFLYVPVRLTFTGIPAIGNKLLNPSNDAPRAFPIAGSIETLSATINNQGVSINSAEIIHALMRYNVDTDLKSRAYSMTCTYGDQSQSYSDFSIGSRNPLSLYADQPDGSQMARGGFDFTIVQNIASPDGVSVMTSVVDVAFCEPLFISPFYTGKTSDTGMYNITSLDFNFTFINGIANRMWSHNDIGAGNTAILSSSSVFGGLPGGPTTNFVGGPQCQMLFQYITPQESMIIPKQMPVSFPYHDVLRFPTDLGPIGAGVTDYYNSNNIQLSSVPLRVYIYIRERNSDLYSNPNKTDTYFRIDNLNIQFMNSSGLLASASFNSIYDMSRQNGCQLSYTQFGQSVNNNGWTAKFGTVGSVCCIDFAKNVGLPSLMAPGILSQCTLQITAHSTNISGRSINATMYIVPISVGEFTVIGSGNCSKQIGVITPTDVLDCHNKGELNFNDVYDTSFTGGSFFDNLKDFGAKLLPYLQQAHSFIKDNKLVSSVLKEIPGAQRFGQIAERIGYGEGVHSGGAQLHRKDLRRRLANY